MARSPCGNRPRRQRRRTVGAATRARRRHLRTTALAAAVRRVRAGGEAFITLNGRRARLTSADFASGDTLARDRGRFVIAGVGNKKGRDVICWLTSIDGLAPPRRLSTPRLDDSSVHLLAAITWLGGSRAPRAAGSPDPAG